MSNLPFVNRYDHGRLNKTGERRFRDITSNLTNFSVDCWVFRIPSPKKIFLWYADDTSGNISNSEARIFITERFSRIILIRYYSEERPAETAAERAEETMCDNNGNVETISLVVFFPLSEHTRSHNIICLYILILYIIQHKRHFLAVRFTISPDLRPRRPNRHTK